MAPRMNDNVFTAFQQHSVVFDNYLNLIFANSVFMSKHSMRAVSTLMSNYWTIINAESASFATALDRCSIAELSAKAYKMIREYTAQRSGKIDLRCWPDQLKDEDVKTYLSGFHRLNLRVQSSNGTINNWASVTNFLCSNKGLVQQLAISLDYLDEYTLEALDLKEFTCLSEDLQDYHWEILSQVKAHTYVFIESMEHYDFLPLFIVNNVIIREAILPGEVMRVSENLLKLFPNLSNLTMNFTTDRSTLFYEKLKDIFQCLNVYNQLFKEHNVQASLVLDDVRANKFTSYEDFPLDIASLQEIDDQIVKTNWTNKGTKMYNLKYENTNFSFDITFSQ